MTLKEAQKRALEINQMYDVLNTRQIGSVWSRSDLMQGFVGDVGKLAKLTMAKDGRRYIDDVDTKLAHELVDCLWSILILAEKYDIELDIKFAQTMDELEGRISGELNR